ncbi:uncharacterized protein [Nicotiana tomentosiformis]|uniref:uncharacterized protein n=1 Tax=Nicotiana tomentosiformis TaxID=4098 RepID=UPI00388CE816
MPGGPKKYRKKAPDEPTKKYGKRLRKGTPMTCSNCKTVLHNKKGCAILKGQSSLAGAGSNTANARATTTASGGHYGTTGGGGSASQQSTTITTARSATKKNYGTTADSG